MDDSSIADIFEQSMPSMRDTFWEWFFYVVGLGIPYIFPVTVGGIAALIFYYLLRHGIGSFAAWYNAIGGTSKQKQRRAEKKAKDTVDGVSLLGRFVAFIFRRG
jgi:hypothetical protein